MPPSHPTIQPSFNILVIVVNPQEPAAAPPPSPPTSTHAIFAFIVTTFVSFVQIRFPETRTSSPFETHHTAIMVLIASLISYCFSLWATKRFPSYTCVSRITLRFAGLLTLASLLSLLLPDSLHSMSYLILMLIFHFIGEFGQLLQRPWQLTWQAIHGFVSGNPHGRKCAVLPLTLVDLPPIN